MYFVSERPFNLEGGGGGYGFFLKKSSDSQCCWKKYSDFGGGKKKKSDCCPKKKFWTKQKTITPPPPPFKLNGRSLKYGNLENFTHTHTKKIIKDRKLWRESLNFYSNGQLFNQCQYTL